MTWVFLLTITVTFVYVYIQLMSQSKPFQNMLNNKDTWRDKIIIIVLLGILSIIGTYLGKEMTSGANVRDIGVMIAGLVGGPVVGLAAGLIGGIHRFCLGGFTAIPCGLATILIGLICGLIKQVNGNKIISIPWAIVVVVIMECIHMGLTLLIARPFDDALSVVQAVVITMIVANAAGMIVALLIIKNREPLKLKAPPSNINTV